MYTIQVSTSYDIIETNLSELKKVYKSLELGQTITLFEDGKEILIIQKTENNIDIDALPVGLQENAKK